MSTIAIIGSTGYAGGNIAAEALRRGHEVIGVSRTSPGENRPGVTSRQGSLADPAFMEQIASTADVIVVATRATIGDDPFLVPLVPSLLEVADTHDVRLGFVGGAGSLLVAPGGPRLVDTEAFPEIYKFEALSHGQVLDALRASTTNAHWFYVSPAAGFGSHAPGERTGHFRVGGDVLLIDDDGNSFVSGEDFAIAVLDEIEQPRHHRGRLSVAY